MKKDRRTPFFTPAPGPDQTPKKAKTGWVISACLYNIFPLTKRKVPEISSSRFSGSPLSCPVVGTSFSSKFCSSSSYSGLFPPKRPCRPFPRPPFSLPLRFFPPRTPSKGVTVTIDCTFLGLTLPQPPLKRQLPGPPSHSVILPSEAGEKLTGGPTPSHLHYSAGASPRYPPQSPFPIPSFLRSPQFRPVS